MKLRFPGTTELSIFGILLTGIFFGPFNIWWNIALLLGVGLFIALFVMGMAAFVIYAASSAMDFIHEVERRSNKEMPKD